jgi:PAS domain-containing protein
VQGVPGSPWFIVARIDAAEVYAPVRERLWVMVVLVAALLIGAGAGVGLIWRQQSTRVFREKYQAAEALRESERRFRTLFENLAEGVALHELVLDASGAAVDYRVLDVNPRRLGDPALRRGDPAVPGGIRARRARRRALRL